MSCRILLMAFQITLSASKKVFVLPEVLSLLSHLGKLMRKTGGKMH